MPLVATIMLIIGMGCASVLVAVVYDVTRPKVTTCVADGVFVTGVTYGNPRRLYHGDESVHLSGDWACMTSE